MSRKRLQLVPDEGVECFEVRLAFYYEKDGSASIRYEVSTEDDTKHRPPLHEVLGVLEFSKHLIVDEYEAGFD